MRRALIVDDSRTTRSILKGMLQGLDFEVHEAANGQEALDRLKEFGKFDMAFVDWNMPILNGYEFVKQARQDAANDLMAIMMVTTETELSQVVTALSAGANEYLMKPFTKEMILDKLKLMGVIQDD